VKRRGKLERENRKKSLLSYLKNWKEKVEQSRHNETVEYFLIAIGSMFFTPD